VSPSADTCGDTAGPGQLYALANVYEPRQTEVRARMGITGRPRASTTRAGSSLPSGYAMAVSTTEDIPERLRETGFSGPQGEIAWDPDEAIKVAQWLNQMRQAVLSGDALGWLADGSVCATLSPADPSRRLISGWDVRGRSAAEQWEDYCQFCLDSAVVALHDPVTPGDVAEEVVAVRYRLSWRDSIGSSGPEPLPGNPPALYWG
jgi:hypothetical protein